MVPVVVNGISARQRQTKQASAGCTLQSAWEHREKKKKIPNIYDLRKYFTKEDNQDYVQVKRNLNNLQ